MRLLLFCLLFSNFAFSQNSNQQLAYQYYVNGEFEKAISLYEELLWDHDDELQFFIEGNRIVIRNLDQENG